jgi:hypothetical protein
MPSNAAAEGTSSSAATAPSAHVYARRDPITKKPRYLSETTRTYAEAEKALTRLLAPVDRERSSTTSGTVGYLLSRWLEVADLELSTRDGYEGYIRRNIIPALGDVPLRKLDTETLDRFYAHLRAYGRRCRVCWARAGRPGAGVPDRPWRRSGALQMAAAADGRRPTVGSLGAVRSSCGGSAG